MLIRFRIHELTKNVDLIENPDLNKECRIE